MNYVIGILIGLLVIGVYAIINLMRKIDRVEDAYIDASNINETLYGALREMVVKLREIDDKGSFESDDEVGATFKQLYETVKAVDEVFITQNEK